MELGRCPICHHRISLEAIAKDQAGRELAAMVAKTDSATGQALLSYLGLFRSPTRDLANDRALVLESVIAQGVSTPMHALTTGTASQPAYNSAAASASRLNDTDW